MMGKRQKLNRHEKFLIGFIIILLLAILFNWKDVSDKIKASLNNYKQTEAKGK